MRKITFILIIGVFALTACSSNRDKSAETVLDAGTKVALSVQETVQAMGNNNAAEPNNISSATTPVATKLPVKTAFPTYTPRPQVEQTPKVTFDQIEKTIDSAVIDGFSGNVYSFPVITLVDVKAFKNIEYEELIDGETLVQLTVRMNNPGDTIAQYGSEYFKAFDTNGVGHEPNYSVNDCDIDGEADILPGGTLEGCLEFKIPNIEQKFVLTYAPYQRDQYGDGRFLKWEIGYTEAAFPQFIKPVITAADPLRTSFSDGWVYMLPSDTVGEMRYIGDYPIKSIRLKGILYNDKGEIVDEVDGFSWQDGVLPGDKIIFKLETSSTLMNNVSKIDLTISAEAVNQEDVPYIYREFEMKDFQLKPLEGGEYKMIGEVVNTGDKNPYGIGLYVIAYDKSGNIIGFNQATAGFELSSFDPGVSSPVDGTIRIDHPDGLDAIDHFEFIFDAYSS